MEDAKWVITLIRYGTSIMHYHKNFKLTTNIDESTRYDDYDSSFMQTAIDLIYHRYGDDFKIRFGKVGWYK